MTIPEEPLRRRRDRGVPTGAGASGRHSRFRYHPDTGTDSATQAHDGDGAAADVRHPDHHRDRSTGQWEASATSGAARFAVADAAARVPDASMVPSATTAGSVDAAVTGGVTQSRPFEVEPDAQEWPRVRRSSYVGPLDERAYESWSDRRYRDSRGGGADTGYVGVDSVGVGSVGAGSVGAGFVGDAGQALGAPDAGAYPPELNLPDISLLNLSRSELVTPVMDASVAEPAATTGDELSRMNYQSVQGTYQPVQENYQPVQENYQVSRTDYPSAAPDTGILIEPTPMSIMPPPVQDGLPSVSSALPPTTSAPAYTPAVPILSPVPPTFAETVLSPVPPTFAETVLPPVPPTFAETVLSPVSPTFAETVLPPVSPTFAETVLPPVPPTFAEAALPPAPLAFAETALPPAPPTFAETVLPLAPSTFAETALPDVPSYADAPVTPVAEFESTYVPPLAPATDASPGYTHTPSIPVVDPIPVVVSAEPTPIDTPSWSFLPAPEPVESPESVPSVSLTDPASPVSLTDPASPVSLTDPAWPVSFTAPSEVKPVGHWTSQLDGTVSENTAEVVVAPVSTTEALPVEPIALTSVPTPTTANDLILPSMHDTGGVVRSAEGGMLLTDSISLPSSLGIMGAQPSQIDSPEVDRSLDRVEDIGTDFRPVTAAHAISRKGTSSGVVTTTSKDKANLLLVLGLSVGFLALAVFATLIIGTVTNLL